MPMPIGTSYQVRLSVCHHLISDPGKMQVINLETVDVDSLAEAQSLCEDWMDSVSEDELECLWVEIITTTAEAINKS